MAGNPPQQKNLPGNPAQIGAQRAQGVGNPRGQQRRQMNRRDMERMYNFNMNRAREAEDWIEIGNADDRREVAELDRQIQNRNRGGRGRRRGRNGQGGRDRSRSRGAPEVRAEVIDGPGRGGQAVRQNWSVNLDYSSFSVMAHSLYDTMAAKDTRLRRSMPFCMFQHYLAEILNAILIERSIRLNVDARFETEMHPFQVLGISEMHIPEPFIQWLNGVSVNALQNGDVVHPNLPSGGTPQHRLLVQAANQRARLPEIVLPSGTFGPCVALNHNAYECYVSPFVTMSLITETLRVRRAAQRPAEWNPFPAGTFPNGCMPTLNLLGYEIPEILTPEGEQSLVGIEFHNENSMAGRLCHSVEVMTRVNTVLAAHMNDFKYTMGPGHDAANSAAFIISHRQIATRNADRLAYGTATLESVDAFGVAAANSAIRFAYLRRRAAGAAGLCFLDADGEPPAQFAANINRNFEMLDPFTPTYGVVNPMIPILRFIEVSADGNRREIYRQWLQKAYLQRL